MSEYDDVKLIQMTLDGCSDSLNELDRRYGGVYVQIKDSYEGFLNEKTYDPDFILSDSKYLIFKAARTYNSKKNTKFMTWLTIIVRGYFLDAVKKKKNFSDVRLANDDRVEEPMETIFDNLDFLDDESRQMVVLKYEHGYTLKEIAQKMKVSLGKIERSHVATLSLLRDKMTQYC